MGYGCFYNYLQDIIFYNTTWHYKKVMDILVPKVHLLDGISFIEVEPSLHANTWLSFKSTKHQPTSVAMH